MEKLNDYLKTLLSSCGDELRLEPDKNPYVLAGDQPRDVANVPLLGTQISTIVFPLIPDSVKAQLPHNSEVEFVHPHNLGNFSFTIQKSPAGFVVSIRPLLNDSNSSKPVPKPASQAAAAPVAAAIESPSAPTNVQSVPFTLEPELPPLVEYQLESSSAAYDAATAESVDTGTLPDLIFDDKVSAPEYIPTGDPEIEVISANDPQFQTVFSDTSDYEPPGRRDDFEVGAPTILETFEPTTEPVVTQSFDLPSVEAAFTPKEQPMFMEPAMPETSAPTAPAETYVPPAPPAVPQVPAQAAFVPAVSDPMMANRMEAMFRKIADLGASDLHLSVGVGPMMRKDGKIRPLNDGMTPLAPEVLRDMLMSIMPAKNQKEFAERHDTDFAYEISGLARFRCNIFMDRKGMGAVFRIIPSKILTAEQLGLSKAIMDLCTLSKGLVVVTGPSGSGKSTTLCAMVDSINKNREDHVITIEDPIEFVHDNHKCLVNQREVHNHTDSFKDALRAALREDPDIVLVGEMRDLETISIAIETAETGHLVFGTLHTTTAASTVDRIIDQFPADRQQQIRVMLSESLKGVIAQTLLPKKGGGRVAALEVLIVTPAISNLIREGKTFQVPSAMQTGKTLGMVMLNDSLFEHVKNGTVEPRDAYLKAVDKTGFEMMLTRGGFSL
ncbi:MAG: type IV pilus twitching motility protein PilT [Pyrinomonadaceae bacterium]